MVINAINHFWNFGLWLREIQRFYRNGHLMRADLLWMLEYALKSPFTISRQATQGQQIPSDLSVYGETPWTTLAQICDAVGLQPGEVFVDLGAGTGRNLLFVHYWYGAQAVGYELIPRFVEKFNWLKKHLHLTKIVEIYEKNWFEINLKGDVFLLVGTCYSDFHLQIAQKKLSELPVQTRIVTVSYPLDAAYFDLLRSFEAPFSWGSGTVYIQHRRN